MTALGVINCNPLNIRFSERNKWVGQLEPNKGFCVFDTPINGIRAGAVLIMAHADRRGADTIRALISIWAPSSENDTSAYVENVSKMTGIDPDHVLSFHEYETMRVVIAAMIRVECGYQPYTRAQLDAGLARAGLVPGVEKPLGKSRTVQGAKVATAATVAGMGLESVRQVADYATDFAPLIRLALSYGPWLIGALALAGIGYVVYARWDDRRRALR